MSTPSEDASAAAPTYPPAAAPDEGAKKPTVVQTSLALVKTTVKEFDSVEAGLARLQKRYENVVYDVSTTKGMKEATDARMAIREPRYKVKNALDAAKKALNALKAEITARAEALTERILALETPIDEQIKAEDKRKADEKAAREEADRKRILAITDRIAAIRAMATRAAACRTSARVAEILAALDATDMTGMDEFEAEAIAARSVTREAIDATLTAMKTNEAEAQRLREEQEALAAQQAEVARQQKALDDARAAFEAQQPATLSDAVSTFEQAAQEHHARPLFADDSPAQAALHGVAAAAVAAGTAIVDSLPTEPVWIGVDLASGPDVSTGDETGDVVAEIRAGFDAAIYGPITKPAHNPVSANPTDQEVMDTAIEAVASYFDITEQAALERLSAIRAWTYQGHALAA